MREGSWTSPRKKCEALAAVSAELQGMVGRRAQHSRIPSQGPEFGLPASRQLTGLTNKQQPGWKWSTSSGSGKIFGVPVQESIKRLRAETWRQHIISVNGVVCDAGL
jgi:hypothetical protein